jgi:hypothetical protein
VTDPEIIECARRYWREPDFPDSRWRPLWLLPWWIEWRYSFSFLRPSAPYAFAHREYRRRPPAGRP